MDLISVSEAKKLIETHVVLLPQKLFALQDAAGKILAKDIYAPVNVPSFPQSSMDGYAFAFESMGKPIAISGEHQAGTTTFSKVAIGTAVRIFTGAVVPTGADTVVMQEKIKIIDRFLQIEDTNLKQGDNVRLPGTEVKKDSLALASGSKLTAAAIGFLAGMGIAEVAIIPNPRVSIIVTGNELQKPGTAQEFGKVYESNSFALLAALQQINIINTTVYTCLDDIDALTKTLQLALLISDVVLMTGGVSVGEYDFTVKASQNCGIKKIFHKIKQKPGKPIFFGTKEEKIFFGLPGNPSSVLTCFYEYVLLALEKMTTQKLQLKKIQAPLLSSFKKALGLTYFLKATFDGEKANIMQGQESYKLNSFATANCLAVIPEAVTDIAANETIEIHLLP